MVHNELLSIKFCSCLYLTLTPCSKLGLQPPGELV